MQSTKPLRQKLQIKDGYRMRIVNAPEYISSIPGILPENIQILESGAEDLDVLLLFAGNREELAQHFQETFQTLKADGLLWICYPKISSGVESDITRDKGWDPVFAAGLRPVAQVAIDATWSALRFRPVPEKSIHKIGG